MSLLSYFSILNESKRSKRLIAQNWDTDIVNRVDKLYKDEDFFMLMLRVHFVIDAFQKYGESIFDGSNDKVKKFMDMFGGSPSDMRRFVNTFQNQLMPREPEFASSVNYAMGLPESKDFTVWKSKGKYKTFPEIGLELHNNVEQNKKNLESKSRATTEGEVFMELPDGWKWWKLPKEYSETEAQMMGHSGNVTSWKSGDTYYSLRNPSNEPYISFITNGDNVVDVKGRFNEKPQQEYMQYIALLLSNPQVASSIDHRVYLDHTGTPYNPDANLFWNDFSEEQQELIMSTNPTFSP